MSTKRCYYQIRYRFLKNNDERYNYYILSKNHHTHFYNQYNEKDVISKVKELEKINPKDYFWYTEIKEQDKFIDNYEHGTIAID